MVRSTGLPEQPRSFVIRSHRMTPSQKAALETLSSQYVLNPDIAVENTATLFGVEAPLIVEIGFGMGDSLLAQAAANPQQCFIGIEVHPPGVGRVLHQIALQGLHNIRLYHHDAIPILQNILAPHIVDKIQLYFPDPWPKKRHHKRRIVQPRFLEAVARVLKPGGAFHLATDVEDYAEAMRTVLEAHSAFQNVYGENAWAPTEGLRPPTKFENRGLQLGHGVYDLVYQTKKNCRPERNEVKPRELG